MSVELTQIGDEIDTVWVEIDYAILQHFSKHLYSSPNKAVEELVTNGYDALATVVDVFLPGEVGGDNLLVWDNGESMDILGLKRLWWIARSAKEDAGEDRIAESADGTIKRRMVGKFGIGKLASYAVGDRVAHLCRRNGDYLLVSVDYNDAPRLTTDGTEQSRGFSTPVRKVTAEQAKELVEGLFNTVPPDLDDLLSESHWTIAMVGGLKEGVSLSPGRLRWILGNGMPLRPDFAVRVNGELVEPSFLSDELVSWSLEAREIQESLGAAWKGARDQAYVEGEIAYGCDLGGQRAREVWVNMPGLGKCYGVLQLFATSLRAGRAGSHGRSEGFFVYVLDRLLNPDDAKLLLSDPSFGAFNRMQAVIHADGLDVELLADRERVRTEGPGAQALKVLQNALYRAARKYLEDYDDNEAEQGSLSNMLPAESREFFRQPLVALAQHRAAEGTAPLNAAKATVVSEPGGESEPLMALRPETNQLVLNENHPLFAAARARLGSGQVAREALKLVELLAISDTLFTGHLLDKGMSDDEVDDVSRWRDGQIRALAVRFEQTPDQVVAELRDASYVGGARFERALTQMFRMMGFVAERDGLPGRKDVLVVAPIGRGHAKFTAEGKGKRAAAGAKDKVANDESEISGASAHAKAAGAAFALVVARDFQGFAVKKENDSDEAAVLQECKCQDPPVSIVTVDALIAAHAAVKRNQYPLPVLISALEVIETPVSKLARIAAMERPLGSFDVRDLLDRCWALQQGQSSGMPVSVLQLKSSRNDWKEMTDPAFERVIYGLETMTGGLVSFVSQHYAVELLQSPDNIEAAIKSNQPADHGAAENADGDTP